MSLWHTKNAAIVVVVCLFTLSLAGCTIPGFSGATIHVPALKDNFEVVYDPGLPNKWSEDPTYTLRGEGQKTEFYDAFTGEGTECLMVKRTNEFGTEAMMCVSLSTGEELGGAPIVTGGSLLGRQPLSGHNSMPPIYHGFALGMFQGQSLQKGDQFVVFFKGSELNVDVTKVRGDIVEVEMRTILYGLKQNGSLPVSGEWDRDIWEFRYVIDTSIGPFPIEIWNIEYNTLTLELLSLEMEGEPLEPFSLRKEIAFCNHCSWQERGKTPPISGFDAVWALEDALDLALTDSSVKAFYNRNEHVVMTRAAYTIGSFREEILGPIGTDHRTESWEFRLNDPVEGEELRVDVEWIEDRDPTITNIEKTDSNYSLAITMWPKELADPGSWWPWILRGDSDVWVEELRYNVPRDFHFFGHPGQVWMWTSDPETMSGVYAHRIAWEIIIGYPDGGAEWFGVSAVNGQLLSVPGRYVEETR